MPSPLAIRRITIDIKKVRETTDAGLFWVQDEDKITHGWAIVCGCEDTPYYGGEPWSGVQSLLSVLQCIQTAVINSDPLVNEPAHPASKDPAHPDIAVYNRMTFQATLETAILGYCKEPPPYLVPVKTETEAWVRKALPTLIKKAQELSVYDGKTESITFYSMTVTYHFGALAKRLSAL